MKDFALNLVSKSPPNQADRRFTGSKTGNASHFGELLRHLLDGFLYICRGDFEIQFTSTACFSHYQVPDCASCTGVGCRPARAPKWRRSPLDKGFTAAAAAG